MNTKTFFLNSIRASINGEVLTGRSGLSLEEWKEFINLAAAQKVLPLVYDAIYQIEDMPEMVKKALKDMSKQQILGQIQKTSEFVELYKFLKENGVHPLVLKGIVCREIYPNPDSRISADEDLLVTDEECVKANESLIKYGMKPMLAQTKTESDEKQPIEELKDEFEIGYVKSGSSLYIELHKLLFSPGQEAYSDLNRYFKNIHDNAISQHIHGEDIQTPSHTDQLFYLICHAFKHFLHSGFGIRQACDIAMYARQYEDEINWKYIDDSSNEINAGYFTAAIFKIGSKYLDINIKKKDSLNIIKLVDFIDEEPLLNDMLSGGVYGGGEERAHSSNITLNAVKNSKRGKNQSSLLRTVFPKAESLENQYTFLKRHKILLPVAWASRIANYKKAHRRTSDAAKKTIQIGKEREKLLKTYKII